MQHTRFITAMPSSEYPGDMSLQCVLWQVCSISLQQGHAYLQQWLHSSKLGEVDYSEAGREGTVTLSRESDSQKIGGWNFIRGSRARSAVSICSFVLNLNSLAEIIILKEDSRRRYSIAFKRFLMFSNVHTRWYLAAQTCLTHLSVFAVSYCRAVSWFEKKSLFKAFLKIVDLIRRPNNDFYLHLRCKQI